MTSTEKQAAFFDVDRTLVRPGSMERLFIPFLIREGVLKTNDLGRYLGHLAANLGEALNGGAHRNKAHLRHKDVGEIARLAKACVNQRVMPRLSPKGRSAIEEHRRAGRLVVLLTGSLEPLAEALRQELDADLALATPLAQEGGALSGSLAGPRPFGPEKARLARRLAAEKGLDLAQSYAYGDHRADVDLLAAVGRPFAVNPDAGLRREARRRGWPVVYF